MRYALMIVGNNSGVAALTPRRSAEVHVFGVDIIC